MDTLLKADGLKKSFETRHGVVQAIRGVDFTIRTGRTTAIVGESGCGKTTVLRMLLGLLSADEGTVAYQGRPVDRASGIDLRAFRSEVGVVFQNPYSSLDPRMRVRDIIAEPMRAAGWNGADIRHRVGELLGAVGLVAEHASRFPHEFSGGQRQRIAIARALALEPKLLLLDEPTSALDVSVQAQILNLLSDLQSRLGLTYLLITHDLAVVEHMADDILVMYMGQIVEDGPVEEVFRVPSHPYTAALIGAIPRVSGLGRPVLRALEGDIPSPLALPAGCAFASRCPDVRSDCSASEPDLTEGNARKTRCFHPLGEPER
ncbi:oligopeptide/dipeptide ABC transporter ATP-binding protein [Roseibium sp.]|uniref:oligopeptide/dipeptide ABC transporter ATP-binding protein n=1 Tax=Roseibium sp. TaxID=1936156 RepID=UPI003A987132